MQMKINNDTYEVITSQDITNIEKPWINQRSPCHW